MESIIGQDISCYVGCFTHDYLDVVTKDLENLPLYNATGKRKEPILKTTCIDPAQVLVMLFSQIVYHGSSICKDQVCR